MGELSVHFFFRKNFLYIFGFPFYLNEKSKNDFEKILTRKKIDSGKHGLYIMAKLTELFFIAHQSLGYYFI